MDAPLRLTRPRDLKTLLDAYGIRLDSKLGQNFLCDVHVIDHTAAQADGAPVVVEIGAGVGTLTVALAERARRVIAVEIDRRLIPALRSQTARFEGVTVIHGDALELDFPALADEHGPLVVIGNLPYQITSPLLDRVVSARRAIAHGAFMVQRELADKVLAPVGSGQGNALGVRLQAFAEVRPLFRVPRTVFFPRPRVDSTVFRLEVADQPRFRADEEHFFRVVRAAFNLRRKTIKQALIQSPFSELSSERAVAALSAAGVALKRRGETLSLDEFDRIARQLA